VSKNNQQIELSSDLRPGWKRHPFAPELFDQLATQLAGGKDTADSRKRRQKINIAEKAAQQSKHFLNLLDQRFSERKNRIF